MSFEMSTFIAATNQTLTLDDIQNEMTSTITKVQLLLQVNSFYTLTLLLKFKWDIDALKESFHASNNFNDFFIANNVSLKTFPAAPTDPECQLCCATEDVEGLACRHMACGSCWKTYLKNKIESGNPSIECFDCSLLICNDKLEALLGSTELFTAYQKLVVNSYVNYVSHLTWCSKNCGNAVRRTDSNNVICSCGAKFCFQCNRDPHSPASCDHMRLWERACEHHMELGKFAYKQSLEWIQENTQECPKCWSPIQKNGGCQFMYCKHCKHKFCWICRGTWIYEWDHLCSFQKAKTARPNLQEIDSYLLQFNHHKQKLESNHESSSIFESRRVLMFSYVYAYNQKPGKITEDFQKQQKKLKDELDLVKSKKSVKKCEQLRKSILDYCSSSRTGKEVEETKSEKCCCIIIAVFLVLFLCLILAGIVTVSVLLFNCQW